MNALTFLIMNVVIHATITTVENWIPIPKVKQQNMNTPTTPYTVPIEASKTKFPKFGDDAENNDYFESLSPEHSAARNKTFQRREFVRTAKGRSIGNILKCSCLEFYLITLII